MLASSISIPISIPSLQRNQLIRNDTGLLFYWPNGDTPGRGTVKSAHVFRFDVWTGMAQCAENFALIVLVFNSIQTVTFVTTCSIECLGIVGQYGADLLSYFR